MLSCVLVLYGGLLVAAAAGYTLRAPPGGRLPGTKLIQDGVDKYGVAAPPAPPPAPHTPTDGSPGGTIYTRWGRSDCKDGASLVYKGIIGGGNTIDAGAGSEYICIVEVPVWNKTETGFNYYSYMFGTEFKAGDKLFDLKSVAGGTLVNQNAVCAVCHSIRSVHVMIPGTNTCTDIGTEWHREYYGYLMSSKYDHGSQRNFICVDITPEAGRSGGSAQQGSELWPVEAYCGSLPCPEYVSGNEMTCVVCSK